jgi:hypothetical protein
MWRFLWCTVGVICVFFLLFLVRSHWSPNDTLATKIDFVRGDAMERRSRQLATMGAINCGRVGIGGNPKKPTDCALAANSAGAPFRIRYDIQGIDSDVAGGFARTPDGQLFALSFDGDPTGGGGTSFTRQHVTVTECPKPYHFYVNPMGRLNCFQPQLSPPANIMSPNFEPY